MIRLQHKHLIGLILFISLFGPGCAEIGPPPSLIQFQNCWSTAASSGIIDETARESIILGFPPDPNVALPEGGVPAVNTLILDGVATLKDRSPKGVYQIRYPITQQFIYRFIRGEDDFTYALFLQARYKVKDKESAAVKVQLKRYALDTSIGQERSEVLLEVNSDDFNASGGFQTHSAFGNNIQLDFKKYAYYIDAQLISKLDPSPIPTLPRQAESPAVGTITICLGGGPDVD